MPARHNRSTSSPRAGGRVTPKGTRPTGTGADSDPRGHARRTSPLVDRAEFGHDPNRGTRRPAFRAVAPRAGNRGNR